MAAGRVLDNGGAPVAVDAPFRAGQHLYYYRDIADEPAIPFAENVLFQDDWLVVADKPHFLPVTPTGRYVQQSLLVRLKRRLGIETGITCIFSLEPARQSRPPALTEDETLPRGRPRRPIGSLSYMTGIFGLRAAHEVLRLLLPDLQAQAPQDPQIAG